MRQVPRPLPIPARTTPTHPVSSIATIAAADAGRARAAALVDVVVVGGGINGVGIARDLAGRGLSVLLCEKDDLAAHTSSSSTKLIHPRLLGSLRRRLARCYGSRVQTLLASGDLGAQVAPGLFEAELHDLHTHEWARCADDVLWRRTKLGLHLDAAQRAAVVAWCDSHWPSLEAEPRPAEVTMPEGAWS